MSSSAELLRKPGLEWDAEESGFGRRLRTLRSAQGVSQRKLATALGVSESTLSKIETGLRKPPLKAEFYERLHAFFGDNGTDVGALLAAAPRVLRLPREHNQLSGSESSGSYAINLQLRNADLLRALELVEALRTLFRDDAQVQLIREAREVASLGFTTEELDRLKRLRNERQHDEEGLL